MARRGSAARQRSRRGRRRLPRRRIWAQLAVATLMLVSLAAQFSAEWLGTRQPVWQLTERLRDIEPATQFGLNQVRGVTYYELEYDTSSPYLLQQLLSDLPAIQASGFNTVRFVSPWRSFEPVARPTPQYNAAAFANLRRILQAVKDRHMHALLGVTYLGPRWTPGGIDYCTWFTDPDAYSAYEQFVATFMRAILDYADMTYILVFNETAVPCGMGAFDQAKQIADRLQSTLGSLPKRLPADLRRAFTIGFQENSVISLGWGGGKTPLLSPISYDFLGMGFYNPDRSDLDVVRDQYSNGCDLSIVMTCALQRLEKRQARFKRLYPNTPLLVTEAGATHCGTTREHQAQVESAIVTTIQQLSLGFTLWAWRSAPANVDCSPALAFDGLGITTDKGAPTAVSIALRALLASPPQIAGAGVSKLGQTTAVWIMPRSRYPATAFQPRVYIGNQRVDNLKFAFSTTAISFVLPATGPTARCDAAHVCQLGVQLVDPLNGLASHLVAVSVPGG